MYFEKGPWSKITKILANYPENTYFIFETKT